MPRDYKTRHFKHENNPALKEMRDEWNKKYWCVMDSPPKTFSRKWTEALFKEQKTLWSHRELMCLDDPDPTYHYERTDDNYFELYGATYLATDK